MSWTQTPELSANSYDVVPYAGYPFAQTHPDRMATMATLAGLRPASVTNCRVLELGCGNGGNLVPMAHDLPGSQFLGIDAAARPIADGRCLIDELGLRNIELRVADFMALGRELGEFDYIIAHGVYSWVPAEVRDRLMQLCGQHLSPDGIAYISYHVYPGFHMREMMREMMLFNARGTSEPLEFVGQGLALLEFISKALPTGGEGNHDLYGVLIKEHLDLLNRHRHLEQIYHDDMSPVNTGLYFHEFVAHAERHGLQFLSESVLSEMDDGLFAGEVREELTRLAGDNLVLREQYLDFLKCRVFRQSLLCRQKLSPKLGFEDLDLTGFYLASAARAESENPDLSRGAVVEFSGSKGGSLRTDHPGAKAALLVLAEAYPMALGWEELRSRAAQRLGVHGGEVDTRALTEILFGACKRGLVRLHVHRPEFVVEAGDWPVASRLARAQSAKGKSVVSLVHESVYLEEDLSRQFLRLLDGTRDRAALSGELLVLARKLNPEVTAEQVSAAVERNLHRAARSALLVA
jgi:methyltransferase-like protein/SAM-dependent methyltransferase